jgi:hypothetical protein
LTSGFVPTFEACPVQLSLKYSPRSVQDKKKITSLTLKREAVSESYIRSEDKMRSGHNNTLLKNMVENEMDGPLGQSYATEMTDTTPKITNIQSESKRRGVPNATKPGIHHVSGSQHNEMELQIRSKDPRMKHRSLQKKASRVMAQNKIQEFNKPSPMPGEELSLEEAYDRKMASLENQAPQNLSKVSTGNHGQEKCSFDEIDDSKIKKPLITGLEDDFGDDDQGYDSKSNQCLDNNETRILVAHGAAGTPNIKYGFVDGGNCGDKFHDETVAIAIAVDDSYYEAQEYYHHAVEYDPDSKPPLVKNRRFQFYMLMIGLTLLVAGLASGIAVPVMMAGWKEQNSNLYDTPTESPTTMTEGIYREQFIAAVGPKVMDYGSPHDRAAFWIIHEDPQHLSASSENLIQRYILALFYFVTTSNETEPWKSCGRPQDNDNESCEFLRLNRANNDSLIYIPENATRWLSGTDECTWVGISCDTADKGSVIVALEVCKFHYLMYFARDFPSKINMRFHVQRGTKSARNYSL